MSRVPDYVAMAKEASRRWREANGLPPREGLSSLSSLLSQVRTPKNQGHETLERAGGATKATNATKGEEEGMEVYVIPERLLDIAKAVLAATKAPPPATKGSEPAPEVRTPAAPPSVSPVGVAEQLRALWVPQPHLSRYIPDHAAMLYAYLQDHCGEFLTVDALFARRGGPREDLEACLTLLIQGGLVAVLEESDPLRYGAREPRVFGRRPPADAMGSR